MDEKNSHFWNSCPLKLEYFPTTACHLGSTKNTDLRCQWWINSQPDLFCFWTFIKNRSDEEGDMPELQQITIGKLLNLNSANSHSIFKKSIEEFIEILNKNNLIDDFQEIFFVEEFYSESLDPRKV